MKTIDPFKEDPTVLYGTTPKRAIPEPDPNYPDPGPYWVWAQIDNATKPAQV